MSHLYNKANSGVADATLQPFPSLIREFYS